MTDVAGRNEERGEPVKDVCVCGSVDVCVCVVFCMRVCLNGWMSRVRLARACDCVCICVFGWMCLCMLTVWRMEGVGWSKEALYSFICLHTYNIWYTLYKYGNDEDSPIM